jgi:LPXTG-motif cell wall-anchored protein
MTRFIKLGLLALCAAAVTIWLLPAASLGSGLNLHRVDSVLRDATQQLGSAVQQTVAPVRQTVRSTTDKTKAALAEAKRSAARATARATTADPLRDPPQHGTNPNGQGGVAVVDLDPSSERPLGANPDGTDSGEEVVVGRARGEQSPSGAYHGHITIASLFGKELAGVDTAAGETKHGPLQGLQTDVLDKLCDATQNQVCLSLLTADSETTAKGSKNDFAVARANVVGIRVGAAQSGGSISETADCQASAGGSGAANVTAGNGAVAAVANSAATSKSCRNKAPETSRSSQVIGLGGIQVPLPAAGCADGTPDTVGGLPPLLPIVCNADDVAGAAVLREALDVFVLNSGGTSLAKETTSAAQASSVAPKGGGEQCSDGVDNDGDGYIDAADPDCHEGGDLTKPYHPEFPSEGTAPTGPSSGPGTTPGGEGGKPECSDKKDNDGDGLIDSNDPGCHAGNNLDNPYNPDDDNESNGGGGNNGGGPKGPGAGELPFTGSDVVGLGLAGLLVLAGGLLLRRREDARVGA